MLDVIPLGRLPCPKPYPLFRLRKQWLTVLILDSSPNSPSATSWKLTCLPLQYSNPEYFLFYLNQPYPNPTALGFVPLMLKILIAHPSSPTLSTICIPSNSQLTLDVSTLFEFDMVWNSCNGNLQNRPVVVQKFNRLLQPKRSDSCGHESYFVSHCNVLTIAERRNFTFASTRFDKHVHLFRISEDFEVGHLRAILVDVPFHKREYYPGTKIPYNFYIIIPKPKSLKGFQALIEPFSIDTWTAVLLTCMVLGLLLHGAEYTQVNGLLNVKSLLQEFWFVYSVLVLQSSSRIATLAAKLGVKAIWAVGCFMLCAIIMTSLYQGELATTMTTVMFPFIPRTLEDVANSDLLIITSQKRDGLSRLSSQIEVAKSREIYGRRVSNNLEKIMKRIFLVNEQGYHAGIKVIRTGELLRFGDGNQFIIKGQSFAIMDDESETRPLIAGIILSPDFVVYKGRENLPFRNDVMWFWSWNFFSKIYKRSWHGMVEGGLWQRFSFLFILRVARHRAREIGKYGREHLLRVLFKDNKNKEGENFSKINQESILPCYYLFLALLALAIVTLLAELREKLRHRVRHIHLRKPTRKRK